MSPEEARGKWCPFARVAMSDGMAANRTASLGLGGYADIADETRCLAGGCMAWRWQVSPASADAAHPADGYCGFAGEEEDAW